MRQRDRESMTDSDHDLFFGSGDDDLLLDDSYDEHPDDGRGYDPDADDGRARTGVNGHDRPARNGYGDYRGGQTRVAALRNSRRRRRRRMVFVLALLLVIVVGVSGWFIGLPVYRYFHPSDYSGSGSGTALVTVHTDDGASQIGTTLHDDGVVASVRAFTDAAKKNAKSADIQPGSYRMRRHMSASTALALLLNPSSRVDSDVVVPEGITILEVEQRLTAPPCTASSPTGTICGLGLPAAKVRDALENVRALGLPTDFTAGGKVPASAEGFLYPATYPFDGGTSVSGALEQMIGEFTDHAKTSNFSLQAKALNITPYQALIIASIAQSEAKFSSDMPKVARVILNRLAAKRYLQVDATSAYAAKLKGLDPTKTIYAEAAGPYNTYKHLGLPPTPISNPGAAAMTAAAHPATGNWLYYVNADAAGHLFFTNSYPAFTAAQHKCFVNKWGCADS